MTGTWISVVQSHDIYRHPSFRQSVRAELTLNEDVAKFIGSETRRCGMTRKSYITWMIRRALRLPAEYTAASNPLETTKFTL